MSSGRSLRKRCGQDCKDHQFIFKKLTSSNKYQVQLLFCPKYQRDPLPPQQTYPVFNKDKKYYTNSFILGVDKRHIQQNWQHQLMNHQKLIKQSLQKNTQIIFPRPNVRNNKVPTCQVCKVQYANYYGHIDSADHLKNIQNNQYNNYLLELCQGFRNLWDGAQERADQQSNDEQEIQNKNSDNILSNSKNIVNEEKQQQQQAEDEKNDIKEQCINQNYRPNKTQIKKRKTLLVDKVTPSDQTYKEQLEKQKINLKSKRTSTPLLAELLEKKIKHNLNKFGQQSNTSQKMKSSYDLNAPKNKSNRISDEIESDTNKNSYQNIQSLMRNRESVHFQDKQGKKSKKKINSIENIDSSIQFEKKYQKEADNKNNYLPPPSYKQSQLKPYHQYIKSKDTHKTEINNFNNGPQNISLKMQNNVGPYNIYSYQPFQNNSLWNGGYHPFYPHPSVSSSLNYSNMNHPTNIPSRQQMMNRNLNSFQLNQIPYSYQSSAHPSSMMKHPNQDPRQIQNMYSSANIMPKPIGQKNSFVTNTNININLPPFYFSNMPSPYQRYSSYPNSNYYNPIMTSQNQYIHNKKQEEERIYGTQFGSKKQSSNKNNK